ncbi:beta-1,4-galactosyltransferase 4-like isoform X3 [Trichoplusia ni]|uniref:Beta-1,4-N-acetylgalactosaminyltransferase n=1 Tax=Trichoplusia ni TaxID=7111 RepID=A0A7E5WVC7_TRINI|nr:beta-1,4-galactosyltransferase 4-like isoform X3 [Trichoplusia ni]
MNNINAEETRSSCQTFGILFGFGCAKDGYNIHCTRRRWLFVLSLLFLLQCYFNVSVYLNLLQSAGIDRLYYFNAWPNASEEIENKSVEYYKYPIIINSSGISMSFEESFNSSYYWFVAMKPWFKYMGDDDSPKYFLSDTPTCQTNNTYFGRIIVNKQEPTLDLVARENPHVKTGGYYNPAHCRARYRVAVVVPYRDRKEHLAVLLRYIHPLLQKQLLEYRIFVVEQYGNEKFNKGTLYNIAFLESQRFGSWDCLIFHDVDLIPEDERISYSCQENPTHMSPAVESFGYKLIFGGVTSLTPEQYRAVNGYSNFYWNWGAEDDDFYYRLQLKNYTVARYDSSIARYASLPHKHSTIGNERYLTRTLLLMLSKLRARKEGLISTKYNLVQVTKEKLFTHILADVNPMKIDLDTKTLVQEVINLQGNTIEYGRQERELSNPTVM